MIRKRKMLSAITTYVMVVGMLFSHPILLLMRILYLNQNRFMIVFHGHGFIAIRLRQHIIV